MNKAIITMKLNGETTYFTGSNFMTPFQNAAQRFNSVEIAVDVMKDIRKHGIKGAVYDILTV